jgi:hypothetical protein
MDVRMEVGSKRAEGLDGADRPRPYVFTLEKLLEALSDALLSGLGEKGEQGAFALEKPPESLGDRENKMSMRHRLQDLFPELLGEQDRALGLAGGAKIPRLARKREQMLASTGRTSDAGEASTKPTAVEESLDGGADHRSKRTRLGFKSLLVSIEVVVEVLSSNW